MLEYELYKLGRRSIFTRRQRLGEFLGHREHASVAEGGDGFEHCQKADGRMDADGPKASESWR